MLCLCNITVFVEKVMRVQPDVKKLYLLLRAPDAESATQRLHTEVDAEMLLLMSQYITKQYKTN